MVEGRGRGATRHAAAVEALDLRRGEHVLEVGCGRGALAELVCARLEDGRYLGLDRSAPAVAAAVQRLPGPVSRGCASFVRSALADADPHLGPFDAVVAVDVNLFWTSPAVRELAVLQQLLRPTGRLVLVHHPPDAALLPRLEAAVARHLEAAGWSATARTCPATGPSPELLVVTAGTPGAPRRPGRPGRRLPAPLDGSGHRRPGSSS